MVHVVIKDRLRQVVLLGVPDHPAGNNPPAHLSTQRNISAFRSVRIVLEFDQLGHGTNSHY
jgi:hypothetical protein